MVILLNKGTNIFRASLLFVIGLLNTSRGLHYFPFPKNSFQNLPNALSLVSERNDSHVLITRVGPHSQAWAQRLLQHVCVIKTIKFFTVSDFHQKFAEEFQLRELHCMHESMH